MRKRVVGLWMAMLLCLGSAIFFANCATAATKTSADFSDLKDLDAATKAKFDAMISAGIFEGVAEGTFGLNDKMNRAQFAKVAALIFALDVDKNAKTSSFTDVTADDPANGYALPYIEAVKAAGITDGYGEGIFNPAGEVNKEQLATMLVRGLGMKEDAKATPGVNDATVSDWAKGYVALAIERKLLANEADGTFGGKSNATRDQLVLSSYETAVTAYEITEQSDPSDQVDDDSLSAHELLLTKLKEAEKKLQVLQDTKEETVGAAPSLPYIPYNPPITYNPPTTRLTLDAPTALPAGGAVASGTQVALKGMPADAAVYYTTDLSEPSTSSSLYTEPITITSSTTIKAIAVHPGSNTSSVARFDYTVTMPIVMPDSISPMSEGELYNGSAAKLSGGTGAVTYAVTNGALPAGLTLDPSTGAITGTPSVSGAYSFTITATDSATPPATATKSYAGSITPVPVTPLDLINEASESGDWSSIDETTFTDAGVTGVTPSNVAAVIDVLSSNGTTPWTVSAIQAIVNSVIADITKQSALDLINAASESGIWTGVDETTFADAGVTGVTSENLYNVQYYLDPAVTTHSPLPRTSTDIQAIVDETIQEMMVTAIYDYLNFYGGGSRPTAEVFARAGITGVDDSNLDAILDELSMAYQEAKWDPFGTPMSTKQDIQNVVDRFLT
jgi:hypothetical protein